MYKKLTVICKFFFISLLLTLQVSALEVSTIEYRDQTKESIRLSLWHQGLKGELVDSSAQDQARNLLEYLPNELQEELTQSL